MLREEKAIVTDIAGTTRDVITEFANIGGVPLELVDTAGIRETDDLVEAIGVERSKKALAEADLVLLVLDASNELTDKDLELLELSKIQIVLFYSTKPTCQKKLIALKFLVILSEFQPLKMKT